MEDDTAESAMMKKEQEERKRIRAFLSTFFFDKPLQKER